MFIKRIYVSNYKSFDFSGDFLDLKEGINIIIGRNDTGKTNFINALDIALGTKSPYQQYFDEKDYYDPTKPIDIEIEIEALTDAELFRSGISDRQRNTIIGSKRSRELTLRLHFSALNEGKKEEENEGSEATKISRIAFYYKDSHDILKSLIIKGAQEIKSAWIRQLIIPTPRDANDYLKSSKRYSPFSMLLQDLISESTERDNLAGLLKTANASLNKIFLDVQDKVLKNAKGITPFESLRFSLTKENAPEELASNISLFLKLKDREFEISQVGTGTQSAVIIAILEFYLSRKAKKAGGAHKFFIIEEPEIYLHPHAIRRVARLLQELSIRKDVQVIVSTHSPDFALLGLPFNLFRFDLIGNKTKIEKFAQPVVDIDESKVHREINRSNSELFFAKSVLFVEGETESVLIPLLAKNYIPAGGLKGDLDLDKYDISIVSLDGNTNFEFYYRYLSKLKINTYFLFDGDIQENLLSSLSTLFDVKTKKKEEMIKVLYEKGVLILSVNEIEEFYTDDILAELKGCSSAEMKKMIENEFYYSNGKLRNSVIHDLLNSHKEDIFNADFLVDEKQIEQWYCEEEAKIRKSGKGGKIRRGKAIEKIFSDIGKVQLGRAIGELIVKNNKYPKEIMDFIERIAKN